MPLLGTVCSNDNYLEYKIIDELDPANADMDIVDENILDKNGFEVDAEFFNKLQKNSLSDRTNSTKIRLLKESK